MCRRVYATTIFTYISANALHTWTAAGMTAVACTSSYTYKWVCLCVQFQGAPYRRAAEAYTAIVAGERTGRCVALLTAAAAAVTCIASECAPSVNCCWPAAGATGSDGDDDDNVKADAGADVVCHDVVVASATVDAALHLAAGWRLISIWLDLTAIHSLRAASNQVKPKL